MQQFIPNETLGADIAPTGPTFLLFKVSIGVLSLLADLTFHKAGSARSGVPLGRAAMPVQMQLLCMVECGAPVTGCAGGQCPLNAPACGQGKACSASAAASLCVPYWQHCTAWASCNVVPSEGRQIISCYRASVGRTAFVFWAVWVLYVSFISFHCWLGDIP